MLTYEHLCRIYGFMHKNLFRVCTTILGGFRGVLWVKGDSINCHLKKESRPAELPRQPLAEPYVNLSIHTAPIIQAITGFALFKSSSRFRLTLKQNRMTQSLGSISITETSMLLRTGPPLFSALVLSPLWIQPFGFLP